MCDKPELVAVIPEDYAVRLTTTINLLEEHRACIQGLAHLLSGLGMASIDADASFQTVRDGLSDALSRLTRDERARPINLLDILRHNGVFDCLWSLCATEQNSDIVARLIAADIAQSCLLAYEQEVPGDNRPRAAINAARQFAIGEIGEEPLRVASAAAWDVVREAHYLPACSTDSSMRISASAADSATAAAWTVSRDAAFAARCAHRAATAVTQAYAPWTAAEDAHARIIRRYLVL